LSIKGVDLIVLLVVEAFCREILWGTFDVKNGMTNNSLLFPIVEEVMMLDILVVEQIDEEQVIVDEGTVNEWVGKVVDRHRVVVQTKGFVDVKLGIFYFFRSPICLTKHSAIKMPIIEVTASKLCARRILLDFIALDIANVFAIFIFFASINLHESHFTSL
jgi:hypothetical protein